MNETFVRLIKENTEFQVSCNAEPVYRLQDEAYRFLEEKYHLPEIAGEHDLDKAVNLLAWVSRHIRHTGNYANTDCQDALTLLGLAFDTDYGINCLAMSVVLCECLLAVGMKARVMYMMPRHPEDDDNHVVVETFVPDLEKWIMLDPTYGSYCMDAGGSILNLYEIRTCIVKDEPFFFSDSICYNGAAVDDLGDVKDYYAKNLFFFRCRRIQGYGEHREYRNMSEIAPKGFDVHKRMVENLRFRIEKYGAFELLLKWLEYEEGLQNRYLDPDTFW